VLDELTESWSESTTKTAALQVWERAWDRFIPFLAFPAEIRRVVYTTDENVKTCTAPKTLVSGDGLVVASVRRG